MSQSLLVCQRRSRSSLSRCRSKPSMGPCEEHRQASKPRRNLSCDPRARFSPAPPRAVSPPHPDLPEPHQEAQTQRMPVTASAPHVGHTASNNVEAAPRANARRPMSSTRRRTPVPSPNSAAVSRAVVRSIVASSAPSGSIPVLRSVISRGSQGRSPGIRQPHVRRYFLMAPM
jgi:hypothetical protein